MRVWIAITMILLGASCGSHPATTTGAPPPKAGVATSNTVTLSAEAQKSSGLQITTVAQQAMPEVVRATARLTNDENRTWRVGAVAEGRMQFIHANPGDTVVKDQVLAEMHSHEIHESRASYKRAQADLARIKGVQAYRQGLRDRAQRLLDLRAGSVAQLEQAETELKNAQTDVRNAEIEIDRTKTHLVEVLGIPAEESDIPQAKDGEDHDLIPVRAPATGVVLTRNVTLGTVVTPASDLFVISDLSTVWAIAEVGEEHLGRLRVGMPANVFVQAYPGRAFRGRIGKLGEVLDPNTHTIRVRIELPNAQGLLKPEMYADAQIEVGRGGLALMLPAEAVQDVRGDAVVFVRVGPDHFELRPVRTGSTVSGSIEILSGLETGDAVVSQAAFILKSEFLKASISGE
jgi:multidrug efflux pump subunit AcrA (membrane-fusion protein)